MSSSARGGQPHDVAVRATGAKHLRHTVVGDLRLDWNAVTWAADPDLRIIVWTAEADTPTHDSLAPGLVQTSGQVGAALVLAVLTAVLSGADGSGADFTPYRPGLDLVTGVATLGLLLNLVPALSHPLGQAQPAPPQHGPEAVPPSSRRRPDPRPGGPEHGRRARHGPHHASPSTPPPVTGWPPRRGSGVLGPSAEIDSVWGRASAPAATPMVGDQPRSRA